MLRVFLFKGDGKLFAAQGIVTAYDRTQAVNLLNEKLGAVGLPQREPLIESDLKEVILDLPKMVVVYDGDM